MIDQLFPPQEKKKKLCPLTASSQIFPWCSHYQINFYTPSWITKATDLFLLLHAGLLAAGEKMVLSLVYNLFLFCSVITAFLLRKFLLLRFSKVLLNFAWQFEENSICLSLKSLKGRKRKYSYCAIDETNCVKVRSLRENQIPIKWTSDKNKDNNNELLHNPQVPVSLHPPTTTASLPHYCLLYISISALFFYSLSPHSFSLYTFTRQQQLRPLPQSIHPFPIVSSSTLAFIDWFLQLTAASLPSSHQFHYFHRNLIFFSSPFFLLHFTPTSLNWFPLLFSSFCHLPALHSSTHQLFPSFLFFSNVLSLYIGFHYHQTIITPSPHSPIFNRMAVFSLLHPLPFLFCFFHSTTWIFLLLLRPLHPSFFVPPPFLSHTVHSFNQLSSLTSTPHNIIIISSPAPSSRCIRGPHSNGSNTVAVAALSANWGNYNLASAVGPVLPFPHLPGSSSLHIPFPLYYSIPPSSSSSPALPQLFATPSLLLTFSPPSNSTSAT